MTTSGVIAVTRSSTGPKVPATTSLTWLTREREGGVGDGLVGHPVLGQRAELRVLRRLAGIRHQLVEGRAGLERGGGRVGGFLGRERPAARWCASRASCSAPCCFS